MSTTDTAQSERLPAVDGDLTLPQITMRLREIVGEIIEAGGAIDAETDQIHDELADLAADKTEAYVAVIKELKAKAKAMEEVERHYKRRRKALKNTVSNLKERLQWSMEELGEEVRETDLGKVRLQTHHARSLHVRAQPDELPEQFRRVSVSADKSAIKEHLEEHELDELVVEGRTVAHLKEPTRFIRIY